MQGRVDTPFAPCVPRSVLSFRGLANREFVRRWLRSGGVQGTLRHEGGSTNVHGWMWPRLFLVGSSLLLFRFCRAAARAAVLTRAGAARDAFGRRRQTVPADGRVRGQAVAVTMKTKVLILLKCFL